MNTLASFGDFLEKNLKNFFEKTPAKKVIIGLSGGVDSALTLAIAVKALGKEKVLGVLMPYRLGEISSYEHFDDAKELAQLLEIEFLEMPIDDFAKPYEKFFSGMVLGNTLARIRMTILFGLANQENGIVLGTCNKSEVMLGYETKFGDGAADVSVIGDLWKTEVWELAREYQLPEKFITKKPSAELFVGHSDESEMGFSYSIADEILKKIENGENLENSTEIVEQKIWKMWKNSEHKRSMAPVLFAHKKIESCI